MLTTLSVHQVVKIEVMPAGGNGSTTWRDIRISDDKGNVTALAAYAAQGATIEVVVLKTEEVL